MNLNIVYVKRIKIKFGFGAFFGKMLLTRIIENNNIDVYFRAG